jgi:hypothetical protein
LKSRLLYINVFLLFFLSGFSQNSNLRQKSIVLSSDTIVLDTLSIIPGTIKFENPSDTLVCKVDLKNKQLIRIKKDSVPLTIKFSYRVYPFNFEKEYFHKDIKQLRKDFSLPNNPFTINFSNKDQNKPKAGFEQDGLTKNGSISRGIMFGNNQDVVVNSSLNLQVSGKLSNDIELSLAATDNNIPIQPEGNTQQLQEFDKVYIQLNDKHSKMLVGDFQIDRPKSYFMNFYKRTQGVLFSNTTDFLSPENKKSSLSTTLTGAVSKGRFARNVIQGTENNQGPYRLTGADREPFIIVLSGTEKVYIDGKQLTRGQENDYVIDYNNSEISFTARNIITKDKRIIVEFQYAERNYARALYFLNSEYKTDNTRMFFNLYQESDNKNKTLMQSLTDDEKILLTKIGDTLSSAVTPGYSVSEFNTTEVFYRRTDTTVNSIVYPGIFVYNRSADSVSYRVKFSLVGSGLGNYRQIQSSANGRVYEWIPPVSGIPQGDYEPVVQLVTPKKKQMITAGAEQQLGRNGKFSLEGVYTVNDKNTFSAYDRNDDDGQGIKFNLGNKTIISKGDSLGKKKFAINYGAGYEFVQKNFSQVERFRSVEFDRDWNRNLSSLILNDQHLINGNFGIEAGKMLSSNYTYNSFIEGNDFTGIRHALTNNFIKGPAKINLNSSLVSTNGNNNGTSFYRHKGVAAYRIKKFVVGYSEEFEHNIFRYTPNDSVLGRSYQFREWEGSISNTDTSGNYFKLFYRERKDLKAYTQSLSDSAYAQNAGFQFNLNKFRNHILRTNMTVRKLQFLGPNVANNAPDNNLLSRIEYSPKLWKGFLQSTIYYEVGYGLELKKEFSYIEVAAGQGQYYWNDYNGNGIKELNEFELAQYPDQAVYIRVWTPTNSYIKVNHDQFSYSMFLRPSVFKKQNSSGLMKLISRFATQTAYRLDKKTQSQFNVLRFNPLDGNPDDSLLTGMAFTFRQALFFNQSDPVFGFDYTYSDNRNKQLLTNGYESRSLQSNELRVRWNITKSFGFFVNGNYGMKSIASQYFASRNYKIQYYEAEPKLSFQPNTAFRLSAIYKRSDKRNVSDGATQHAVLDDAALELKYNQLTKGSISAKADFILISYNDNTNSPIAFEMLNSLKPGQNYTWNLIYQRNLTNNMQISITYDGRKSPGNRIVHIGGAQVRAFF